MKHKLISRAVVLPFIVGAVTGSVVYASQSHPTQSDAVACKTILKASFIEVFQSRPDPLAGKGRPSVCQGLDEETYDEIALEVILEVSREFQPSMGA